jgi:hypothetical protein
MFITEVMFKNLLSTGEVIPEAIPKNLIIDGCLSLCKHDMFSALPDDLTVTGDMDIHGNVSLNHLPRGLVVGGNLNLLGCPVLGGLPSDLKVGGKIYCEYSLLDKIPLEDLPLFINYRFSIIKNLGLGKIGLDYNSQDLKLQKYSEYLVSRIY